MQIILITLITHTRPSSLTHLCTMLHNYVIKYFFTLFSIGINFTSSLEPFCCYILCASECIIAINNKFIFISQTKSNSFFAILQKYIFSNLVNDNFLASQKFELLTAETIGLMPIISTRIFLYFSTVLLLKMIVSRSMYYTLF